MGRILWFVRSETVVAKRLEIVTFVENGILVIQVVSFRQELAFPTDCGQAINAGYQHVCDWKYLPLASRTLLNLLQIIKTIRRLLD